MNETNKIKTTSSCLLKVPFQTYEKDFSFVVNGEEFKTSRLISDLLSPVICQIHSNDPTISTFAINTSQKGDFSCFLNLFNFQDYPIPSNEVPFILEVIEILGNDSIECEDPSRQTEITVDNVLSFIQQHEKFGHFYSKRLSTEIDFLSSHLFEMIESQEEEIGKLSIDTLMRILNNDQIQLNSEDQLLNFVNNLYKSDSKYSILYETVLFENISSESIKEFTAIYDSDDMDRGTWLRLSKRLECEIQNKNSEEKHRYREKPKSGKMFSKGQNEFNGILNYLRAQSKGQIENEVKITSSTASNGYGGQNVIFYEDKDKYFYTSNEANSWLCFDFRERRVIPTDYTVRSCPWDPNNDHPKSWVIECRNENSSWKTVDEQKDCPHLNGKSFVHTFKINGQMSEGFQYIRMRATGPNWENDKDLDLESFEIYGRLI
ncbi:hypothetical protein M9Y10_038506 [Tritrichomonas musculus]|uniref:F5/8 type C domain-containing protein n=1 Tax=Tritrichomonas musculus TaxID=1915356 RepID=A0ABR2K993_9EUKA